VVVVVVEWLVEVLIFLPHLSDVINTKHIFLL
jgi:hypothetical protein